MKKLKKELLQSIMNEISKLIGKDFDVELIHKNNYIRAKNIWNFKEAETNFYESIKMDYQKNSMFNIFANT